MLNESPAREGMSKALAPLGRVLGSVGIHPNVVTLVGTLGSIAGALVFVARGQFFVGCMVITFFVLLDLLDGALARATGKASKFGAVLDSTGDRLADAAIFGGLVWWFGHTTPDGAMLIASLLALVFGQATSYVKARAEGLGIACNVGLAERAERLIIVLVGIGLAGLGVPYVLAISLWILVAVSAYTVWQRLLEVFRVSNAEIEATTES